MISLYSYISSHNPCYLICFYESLEPFLINDNSTESPLLTHLEDYWITTFYPFEIIPIVFLNYLGCTELIIILLAYVESMAYIEFMANVEFMTSFSGVLHYGKVSEQSLFISR